jgi:hypothetical protein
VGTPVAAGDATATCQVTYTPAATGVPTRTETLAASYGADATHAISSGSATVTVQPTAKQDCKDGGYRNYGFPDQGTCITSVNTSAHPDPEPLTESQAAPLWRSERSRFALARARPPRPADDDLRLSGRVSRHAIASTRKRAPDRRLASAQPRKR